MTLAPFDQRERPATAPVGRLGRGWAATGSAAAGAWYRSRAPPRPGPRATPWPAATVASAASPAPEPAGTVRCTGAGGRRGGGCDARSKDGPAAGRVRRAGGAAGGRLLRAGARG